MEKFGGYKTRSKRKVHRRERLALKNKVEGEEHPEIYGRLREGTGMKTYLYCPMDYVKTLKPQFRVGELDLPERRKRYTSSREEEDVQMCPCD